MSFSAAGTVVNGTSTLTLVPHVTGNFVLVNGISFTTADPVTALSSSNATWAQLVAPVIVGSYIITCFIGHATSTSSATVTATAAGSPTLRLAGQEFSSTAGFSAVTLDTSGTLNATGTAWPSLTPGHGAGELYFGSELNAGSGSAGATSGYTYQVDSNGNGLAYNLNCGGSATSPVWADSDLRDVLAVLLYEHTTSAPNLAKVGIV